MLPEDFQRSTECVYTSTLFSTGTGSGGCARGPEPRACFWRPRSSFPAIPTWRILLPSPGSRKAYYALRGVPRLQALRSRRHLTCRLNLLARTVSSPGLFPQRDTQDTPGAAGPGPQTCRAPGASDASHHPGKRKAGQKTPGAPPNHCRFPSPLLFILLRM